MRKQIKLRSITEEEKKEVRRLAKSRTASMRMVQRAKIIEAMIEDPDLRASHAGQKAGLKSEASGVKWVKRFNEAGIAGLEDKQRSGRPVTYKEEVRGKLIDLVMQKPRTLGYPFELWTMERLQDAYEEREHIHVALSTIWEWLKAEGLNWRRQQSWFHETEHHDPDFVQKRGQ